MASWYIYPLAMAMGSDPLIGAGERYVVVPSRAGPVRWLSEIDKPRGEIDLMVDDILGQVDDDGPGAADAVLVTGGAAAIVASQLAALPAAVLVGGIAAVGIGAILPVRSLIRRGKSSQRTKKISSLIGDGQLLHFGDPLIAELLAAYTEVLDRSARLTAAGELRSRSVAHGLVEEVATLLEGNPPTAAEAGYVSARLTAIREVAELLDNDHDEVAARHAHVEARLEVEDTASSALIDAQELTNDLLTDHDL